MKLGIIHLTGMPYSAKPALRFRQGNIDRNDTSIVLPEAWRTLTPEENRRIKTLADTFIQRFKTFQPKPRPLFHLAIPNPPYAQEAMKQLLDLDFWDAILKTRNTPEQPSLIVKSSGDLLYAYRPATRDLFAFSAEAEHDTRYPGYRIRLNKRFEPRRVSFLPAWFDYVLTAWQQYPLKRNCFIDEISHKRRLEIGLDPKPDPNAFKFPHFPGF